MAALPNLLNTDVFGGGKRLFIVLASLLRFLLELGLLIS